MQDERRVRLAGARVAARVADDRQAPVQEVVNRHEDEAALEQVHRLRTQGSGKRDASGANFATKLEMSCGNLNPRAR